VTERFVSSSASRPCVSCQLEDTEAGLAIRMDIDLQLVVSSAGALLAVVPSGAAERLGSCGTSVLIGLKSMRLRCGRQDAIEAMNSW